MSKPFKPMLAATVEDLSTLNFPLLASPKLDGIRCIVRNGIAYSRSNKPIRNRHVQACIAAHAEALEGLDGELIVGSATAHDVYRTTNSAVARIEGTPDFKFYVFDHCLQGSDSFTDRLFTLANIDHLPPFVHLLPQTPVNSLGDLLTYEQSTLDVGYEGVMLRTPDGPYKQNRSTLREGYLIKLKRFTDAEAVCIGYGELMHNGNEAVTNELGRTARSSAQAGLIPGGTLGYLLCKTPDGVEFKIGTGFDAADRDDLWAEQDKLMGRIVKYKSFPVGVKDAPRHPVWLGFRHPDDM